MKTFQLLVAIIVAIRLVQPESFRTCYICSDHRSCAMQPRLERCQYDDDGCLTYFEENVIVGKSCESNLRRRLNGELGYMPINIERAIGGNYTDIHICFKRDLCNYAFKTQNTVVLISSFIVTVFMAFF